MKRFNEKKIVIDVALMVAENKDTDMYILTDMIRQNIYDEYGWTPSTTKFINYKLNLLVARLYEIIKQKQ